MNNLKVEREDEMKNAIAFLDRPEVKSVSPPNILLLEDDSTQAYYAGYFDGITECLALFQQSPMTLFMAFHYLAGRCAKKYFESAESDFPESLEV